MYKNKCIHMYALLHLCYDILVTYAATTDRILLSLSNYQDYYALLLINPPPPPLLPINSAAYLSEGVGLLSNYLFPTFLGYTPSIL